MTVFSFSLNSTFCLLHFSSSSVCKLWSTSACWPYLLFLPNAARKMAKCDENIIDQAPFQNSYPNGLFLAGGHASRSCGEFSAPTPLGSFPWWNNPRWKSRAQILASCFGGSRTLGLAPTLRMWVQWQRNWTIHFRTLRGMRARGNERYSKHRSICVLSPSIWELPDKRRHEEQTREGGSACTKHHRSEYIPLREIVLLE